MSRNTQPTNDDTVTQLCHDVEQIDLTDSVTEQKPAAKTIITIDIVPGTPDDDDDDVFDYCENYYKNYDEENDPDYELIEDYESDEDMDERSPEEIMTNLISFIRSININGLTWSVGHQVIPVYGTLSKLRINASIVDELVPSTEDLTDLIVRSANKTVRSAEVISFQKV